MRAGSCGRTLRCGRPAARTPGKESSGWRGRSVVAVVFARLVFAREDQLTYLDVELIGVRDEGDVPERLFLARRLEDELTIPEQLPEQGALEAHVGHLDQRHHRHLASQHPRR